MNLEDFFSEHKKVAIAFSGGVDSSYLLYEALRFGCVVDAFFVKTAFQPQFELDDARKLAQQLYASMTVLEYNVFAHPEVIANSGDRCYHCKKALFTQLQEAARSKGHEVLIDGTNASDDSADRPGMRALSELLVRSPLRECGITKAQVRERSREAGLFTHDKPAYACLATRIPTGIAINAENLTKVEQAEADLHRIGFSDLRVRVHGEGAKLQLPASQFAKAAALHEDICRELGSRFEEILLDLKPRG